jgi:POT family proton-dependent oligopeptide transporter
MDVAFLTPVVWCILITETVERFAYFGFRACLVLYFINSLKYSEETSIALYAYVTCLAYASPMLGAFLADAYLGRYKTILCFGWLYALGFAILTVGAYLEDNLELRRTLSFCGLFLFCMGTGGIKPCVSAFGADQVASMEKVTDDGTTDIDTTSNASERVRAFFATFYFCINLGAVTSISIIPIVKHHFGFGAAFLLPFIFIVIAMLVFLSKRRDYVHHVPGQDGSSLSTTFALCIWVVRKELARNLWIARICPCVKPKRSPIGADDNEEDESTNQQLADAKQVLRVLPIMAFFPIFWLLYDQTSSVWTLQATRMKLHGLLAEQLIVVNPVEIMIFIPLFDRVIYPGLESYGWNISHLSRMRWGMFLTAVSFSMSGILETWIQNSEASTISVFWQLPQITILAVAEICVSVTGLEFAYAMSPERLKAVITGVYLMMTAIGNLFGGILYSSVFQDLNRATVMQICAILMLCNLTAFCWVGSSWEKRKDEEENKDVELNSMRGLRDPSPSPPSPSPRRKVVCELMGPVKADNLTK